MLDFGHCDRFGTPTRISAFRFEPIAFLRASNLRHTSPDQPAGRSISVTHLAFRIGHAMGRGGAKPVAPQVLGMVVGSWNTQRVNRMMDLCGSILTGDCIWNFTPAASPPTLDCLRIANSTTLSG
jgi:hypothetical protein